MSIKVIKKGFNQGWNKVKLSNEDRPVFTAELMAALGQNGSGVKSRTSLYKYLNGETECTEDIALRVEEVFKKWGVPVKFIWDKILKVTATVTEIKA